MANRAIFDGVGRIEETRLDEWCRRDGMRLDAFPIHFLCKHESIDWAAPVA